MKITEKKTKLIKGKKYEKHVVQDLKEGMNSWKLQWSERKENCGWFYSVDNFLEKMGLNAVA